MKRACDLVIMAHCDPYDLLRGGGSVLRKAVDRIRVIAKNRTPVLATLGSNGPVGATAQLLQKEFRGPIKPMGAEFFRHDIKTFVERARQLAGNKSVVVCVADPQFVGRVLDMAGSKPGCVRFAVPHHIQLLSRGCLGRSHHSMRVAQ